MCQFVVTPEVLASKISNIKNIMSPGVEGKAPKMLKETVEPTSIPLAHVFSMSILEAIAPL